MIPASVANAEVPIPEMGHPNDRDFQGHPHCQRQNWNKIEIIIQMDIKALAMSDGIINKF